MNAEQARATLKERITDSLRALKGPQPHPDASEPWAPLADLMSEISEETWCAGWMLDLEFVLWQQLMGDYDASGLTSMDVLPRPLDSGSLRLAQYALALGGWVVGCNTPAFTNMFVPFDAWLVMYAEWREKRR